ncbi:hypothetical protein [Yinghuangia seranimata]|uniref:hypothetical protein n=1 Tax=Yinghuangia seranimata TaxID=408067 RepID=UPI00248C107B|nr:hypothetical protein [Yinghuangia seranimata]MDI2130850.1 hypothetical protein [Yinghuangia seranimata]
MADSPWRKSIRESTVKNRTNTVNWAAKGLIHSDLLTALILGAACIAAVVLHLRGRDAKAEWVGVAVALPWVLAAYRHHKICKPCPRQRGG